MKPVTITAGGTAKPKLNRDGKTIVVSIPISLQRTGGRKKVVTPANVVPGHRRQLASTTRSSRRWLGRIAGAACWN